MISLSRPPLRAALAALLLAPAPLPAQARSPERFESVRTVIRQAMQEHDIPAVAVAVAQGGRIVWEEGFGWADLERRVPATPETMFSLASISKPMTATALMRLVERGQVELDRPANDYLGEGTIHSREWDPAGATVRRVLSHTAGLPLHYEFFYEGEDHPARTTDEGIARFGVLVTPPGEVYEYSNLGYGILDRIVERVSGRSYAEFMESEIFRPLGMRRSVVSTGAGLGEAAAVRYDARNRPIPPYDFDHRGGSAVYASARDLVRFGMFHLGHPAPGGGAVLGDGARRAMQEVATPGSRDAGYGLGWGIADDHGHRRVSHTGGMPGVSTALALYPEEDVALVVLANKSNPKVGAIAQEIAGVMLPRYREARRAREAGAAPPAPRAAFAPTPELLGEWRGTVRTHEGDVPLSLVFHPDGDVHVQLADGMRTLLNSVSFRDGRLLGRFAGSVPMEDARRHPHTVLLNLRLRDGRLAGAASAQTIEDPIFFALSSYAELTRAAPPPDDSAAVVEVIRRYHAALAAADSATALSLLTPDAVVLESGGMETREEYRSHHLPADIEFSRAVPSERGPVRVSVLGDMAWAASTSTSRGTFRDREINSQGAELMVLRRTPDGWRIQAIHWSSRNRRS